MTRGYGTGTIRWTDGSVHHDPEAFDLEEVDTGAARVRAYAGRPASVDAVFGDAVERAPETTAFAFPDRTERFSYREFDERVDRVATGLADAGVEAGDVVSLFLSNGPPFVEAFFACVRIGAVAAPVNTRVSGRELGTLLADADPAAIVTESDYAPLFADAGYDPDPERYFVVGGSAGRPYADLRGADPSPPAVAVDEFDACVVLYTSGTTGRPKGCVGSHFNLVNGALNYRVSFGTGEGLRTMVTIPLFHGAGLVSNLLHTVANAGTTVVLDGVGPDEFLATIERERIEYTLDVPTNYVLAMEQGDPGAYDLSSLDVAAYGGAPMPTESIRRLRKVFEGTRLCDGYGTSETVAGLVTMCPDEYTDDRAETIGLPTPPVGLAVLDEEGDPLGPDAVGELAIRGPIVVEGYHNRPAETEAAFGDGWHFTGDLARIDEEGFVELKGRSRDKIVRGGENVYTLDVEETLTGHGKVLEASVTGIPDRVLGERVLAAVVPKPGVRLTEDELREYCAPRLAEFKRPELYRILDELPKNPGGKVLKHELVPEPLRHGIAASDR